VFYGETMKTTLLSLALAVLLAGCGSLPQPTGKVRVCVAESSICTFEDAGSPPVRRY
jgi:hypothetical protein